MKIQVNSIRLHVLRAYVYYMEYTVRSCKWRGERFARQLLWQMFARDAKEKKWPDAVSCQYSKAVDPFMLLEEPTDMLYKQDLSVMARSHRLTSLCQICLVLHRTWLVEQSGKTGTIT